MLNRRTLRVKAMQALFAYEQCKEASYNVALEQIRQNFEPDLNSMEIQDPVQLANQKKKSLELFDALMKKGEAAWNEDVDESVEDWTRKIYEDYDSNIRKDFNQIIKRIKTEGDSIFNSFLRIINLIILFSDFAKQGVGSKKSHLEEQSNLANNQVIRVLDGNKQVEEEDLKKNLTWTDAPTARDWFKGIVVPDDVYKKYINIKNPVLKDDYEIVNHLVRRILFGNEEIQDYWEDQDIQWAENAPIIRSLLTKTIKSVLKSGEKFEIANLSYNLKEDLDYYENLFKRTTEMESELEKLIGEKTKNWDFERIAFTDRLILMLAVCEMINFPSIPLKVTINEFIEVSKSYSTPKSKQFVNGILDVIAVDLQEKGQIKKSGRGLIDN